MVFDNPPHEFAVGSVGRQLQEEAFTEIAGGHAHRLQLLDHLQRPFGKLQLVGRRVGRQHVPQADSKVAAIAGVERGDDAFRQVAELVVQIDIGQLPEEMIVERFRAAFDVRDRVMAAIGVLVHAVGRTAGRLVEVLGHFAVEVEEPLEVVGRLLRVDDHLPFALGAVFRIRPVAAVVRPRAAVVRRRADIAVGRRDALASGSIAVGGIAPELVSRIACGVAGIAA